MIIEGWRRDAEKLVSYLPTDAPVAKRIGLLLRDISPKGVEVGAEMFNGTAATLPLSLQPFFIVDRLQLSKTRSTLGQMALALPGVAFVAYGEGLPTVLTLPAHDTAKPLGNASILLHELEHITEREEGLSRASIGAKEQRAYKTNIDILAALDGSDFKAYIDSWPVDFTHIKTAITPQESNSSANIQFQDTTCPKPPKETFLHDMWNEDGTSRQLLQSIGRAAVFEKLTANLNESLIKKLADGIYSQN